MSNGRIVQVIGAVIDVEFAREEVPKVYDALKVTVTGLTLEVQQQLGDGVVRAIAMGSSEGLSRGLDVVNTGGPITIPVGEETLGRILDVLGDPVDEKGPVNARETLPIHRKPPAYEDQKGGNELLETGVKVIDLMCPFARGGKVGLVRRRWGRQDGDHAGTDPQHRHRACRPVGLCRRGRAHPRRQRLLL